MNKEKKEKLSHLEMSDKECTKCRKPIKQNVIDRASTYGKPFTCYAHGQLAKGKTTYQKRYADKDTPLGYIMRTLKYVDKVRIYS